jgi:hypothetical protein
MPLLCGDHVINIFILYAFTFEQVNWLFEQLAEVSLIEAHAVLTDISGELRLQPPAVGVDLSNALTSDGAITFLKPRERTIVQVTQQ